MQELRVLVAEDDNAPRLLLQSWVLASGCQAISPADREPAPGGLQHDGIHVFLQGWDMPEITVIEFWVDGTRLIES